MTIEITLDGPLSRVYKVFHHTPKTVAISELVAVVRYTYADRFPMVEPTHIRVRQWGLGSVSQSWALSPWSKQHR